jgi:hypothetical protein
MKMFTGLLGILVFVADIWAILTILKSNITAGAKLLWCLLVLVLPVLGLLIWYFAGPKS